MLRQEHYYQRRSTLPNLDRATAVDASTVSVKLTAPHSGFLPGLQRVIPAWNLGIR
jgi:hypothetical protein